MPREIQNERAVDAELIMFRPNRFIANIILSYSIQSYLWMQSLKALDIWAFGDFVIFKTGAPQHKMTRWRLKLVQRCAKWVQGCAFIKK